MRLNQNKVQFITFVVFTYKRKKSLLKPLRSAGDKDLSYIWLGDFTWQKEDGLLIPGRQTGEEKFPT